MPALRALHCMASPRRPSVDSVASPSRGPLRRFSVQRVYSRCAPKCSPLAPSCHRGSLVPSTWFLSTTTACSVLTTRALLQPAADPEVHRVSPGFPPAPPLPRELRPAWWFRFPTMHSPREVAPCQQRLSSLTASPEDDAFTRGPLPPCLLTSGTAAALSARRLRASPWCLLHSCSTSRSCSAVRSFIAVRRFQRPTTSSFHGLLFALRPPSFPPGADAPCGAAAARSS